MATNGKRIIFTDADLIHTQELPATEAGILPGSLVENVVGGYAKSTKAATDFANSFLIADYDFMHAGDVDTAYEVDETVFARVLPKDCRANVLVSAGNNITLPNTPLSADGAMLKIAAADGTEKILAYSDEIINVTDAALVRVRGA